MSLSQQVLFGLRAAPTQLLASGRALCLVTLIFVLGVCVRLALVDIADHLLTRNSPVSDPGPPAVLDRPWAHRPPLIHQAPMPEYHSPMLKRPGGSSRSATAAIPAVVT
jgi:hypothetical protein